MLATSVCLLSAGAAAGLAVARLLRVGPQQNGDRRLHRIGAGVYLYRGHFSNSAVLLLPSGPLVVDTQISPRAGAHLAAQIATVSDRPVRTVVNTHYHGDHVGGNAAFPGAEIVACAETARFVVERDGERLEYARTFGLEVQEVSPVVPPTRTFDQHLRLGEGDARIELHRLGPVETSDACVVWWPARRVLAAGDGVSTHGYPYLGVPFLDEGLKDDGAWIGFLRAVRALEPEVLLPGHGPPLVGRRKIAARLRLLEALMTDVLAAVRHELAAGADPAQVVARVERKLARYARRDDLRQSVTSQRFAIYRAINSCLPDRRGRGWWHDLRPSAIQRADAAAAQAEMERTPPGGLPGRVRALVSQRRRPLALALLEAHLQRHPDDALALGLASDVLLGGVRDVRAAVDATDYVRAAADAAKRALARDASAPLALLNLGAIEIFSALILAQDPAPGRQRVEAALASQTLSSAQRRKALFCLAKAHQADDRDQASDQCLRALLPAALRPLFPVLRAKLRSLP
jgi:glyoxylase-like metal-dependent hydrolase (beta-lactamase superfamily II)